MSEARSGLDAFPTLLNMLLRLNESSSVPPIADSLEGVIGSRSRSRSRSGEDCGDRSSEVEPRVASSSKVVCLVEDDDNSESNSDGVILDNRLLFDAFACVPVRDLSEELEGSKRGELVAAPDSLARELGDSMRHDCLRSFARSRPR